MLGSLSQVLIFLSFLSPLFPSLAFPYFFPSFLFDDVITKLIPERIRFDVAIVIPRRYSRNRM